jgi:hypothetical protein
MRKFLLALGTSGLMAAVGAVVVAPTPAVAAPAARAAVEGEPDPVLGVPVFNDPAGSVTAQYAIFQQLARIIDRVPAGQTIRMSWFGFSTPATSTATDPSQADTAEKPNLVERLKSAHRRGVNVRVILDNGLAGRYPAQELGRVLGTSTSASSYLMTCRAKAGCIGKRKLYADTYAYNHNKFLLAGQVVLDNGTTVPNVVFQSSGNLGKWDADTSYNNAITWSEAASYQDYVAYFADQQEFGPGEVGNDDYYRIGSSSESYKTHFFPRKETDGNLHQASTDTVVSLLNPAVCSYVGKTDGLRHQSDIRIVMWSFNRVAIANKLAALIRAGCWVDIVYATMNDSVRNALKNVGGKPIGITACAVEHQGRELKTHSKYLLYDGDYDGDQVPRVVMGSHNYAVSALRNADESLIRIRNARIHASYLHNFYDVRDTCNGKTSPAAAAASVLDDAAAAELEVTDTEQ